tara:strand:+ start:4107 stop:4766 length:660 start_codon:yes stop_codon:yes gene_type:complete
MDIYKYIATNNLLTPKSVIIECGAHKGEDSIKLQALENIETVYCIEADPTNYQSLLKTVESARPRIKTFHHGLSDTNEKKVFYLDVLPEGNGGASSFHRANPSGPLAKLAPIEKPVEIECMTLPTFLTKNKIGKVDFLWLDVESHEYQIFSACDPKTFSKIKYIYVELSYSAFRLGGKECEEVTSLLTKAGFSEITRFGNGGSEIHSWQDNVLFKNTQF